MADTGGSDSDIIVINGKLELDTKSTDRDVQKLISSFKKLQDNSQSKLLKDFQSISSVAKSLDKDLAKMIQTFSKTAAKDNISRLNQVLKEQLSLVKQNTAQVDVWQKALKGLKPGTAEYKKVFGNLENAQMKASAGLAGVTQAYDERQSNQQLLSSRAANFASGAGRALEMGGMATEFGIGQWGQASYRANLYKSQYAAPGQSLATQMAFDPITAALFSQQGGGRQVRDAQEAAKIEHTDKPILGGAFRIGAGLLSAAGGGMGGMAGGGGGGGISSLIGLITQGVKEVVNNGDLAGLSGDAQRQAAQKAVTGGMIQQAVGSGQVNSEYLSALTHEALEKAPTRMSVAEKFAGAGGYNSGMRALQSGIGYGFSQQEMSGISQTLGGTGISDAQRNPQLLKQFLAAQRQGLGNAQELISGGGQFLGMSSSPTSVKALQEFTNAVRDGVLSGFKNPQIAKTFASASLELASAAKGKLADTNFYQAQLMGALSGKAPGEITDRDIQTAKSSIDRSNVLTGGGTTRSLATNLYNIGKQAPGLDIGSQLVLSHMTNPSELLSDKTSPVYKQLLQTLGGGNQTTLAGKVNDIFSSNISGKFSDLGMTLGGDFSEMANTDKRQSFMRGLDNNDKKSLLQKQRMVTALSGVMNIGGREAEQQLNAYLGYTADVTQKGNLKDTSKGTQARGLASTYAAAEANRDAQRGQKEIASAIREAIQMSGQMQQKMLDDPNTAFNKNLGDMTAATIGILNILERQFGKTIDFKSGRDTLMTQEINYVKQIIPPTQGSGTTSPRTK